MAEQLDDSHATIKTQEAEEYDFSFLGNTETRMQRLRRKVRENPLVPVGKWRELLLVDKLLPPS